MRRPLLLPLIPLYRAGLWVKNAAYDRSWLQPKKLSRPVVSVGSLSAGGAGKTPVVKLLARLLAARGFAVDVLSRGYGRGSAAVDAVEPAGDVGRFGDEPVELARAGLRVYVGAERFEAGVLAEAEYSLQANDPAPIRQTAGILHSVQNDKGLRWVHLLDDGFQHRRLARDLDVVLLTRADIEDSLLPGGNLREPLSSLRRAQVVVLREDEAAGLREVAGRFGAAVWVTRRTLLLPRVMPARPLAFCGIARPEGFFGMLRKAGCEVVATVAFADHHAYCPDDMQGLVDRARQAGADGFVTTAKDAVKLGQAALAELETIGPVAVAELELELLDEDATLEAIAHHLGVP